MDHYPWECISIFRKDCRSTLDFVIRDYKAMMALLHFLHQKLYNPRDRKFMFNYKKLKFHMKLQYEAWNRHIEVVTLIKLSVAKTLQIMLRNSARKLKEIVQDKSFNR